MRDKAAQTKDETVEVWRNGKMHIFKVEPIEFHCGVDAVYERKRIKQNCKIFVQNNCPNGFTIT